MVTAPPHTPWSRAAGIMLAAMLFAGCELDAVNVVPPTPQVVVHAVLNADATEQIVLLESSLTGRVAIDSTVRFNPLDPIRSAGGEPLTGADVRLFAGADSTGVPAVETRVAGRGTGRYVIAASVLAVRPGTRYRLRVRTADGREVTGETLVPGAPPQWTPGSGTVAVPVAFARDRDTLQLAWTPVAGARTYAVRVETPFGPWALFSDSTRFSLAGSLRNFFADGLPSVWLPGFRQVATVVAVDRNFYDYSRSGNDPFGGTGLISSVRGGLGLFGSMVGLVRREVTVTDRDRAPLDAAWTGTGPDARTITFDLWIDVAGPTVSSVTGRQRAPEQFIIGTLRSDNLRLAVLSTRSSADTAALFSGRLVGDSLVGQWDARFDTRLPRVLRRGPRSPATVTP